MSISHIAYGFGVLVMAFSILLGVAAFSAAGTPDMLDYFPRGTGRTIDHAFMYFGGGLVLSTLGEIGIAVRKQN